MMDSESQRPATRRPKRRRPPTRRGWNPVVVGTSAAGILLVLVVVVWAAVYFSKSRRGDSRLLGTWQSDAGATIAEIRKTRPVTDKQEQAMRKLFGKMKITYTNSTITTDFDGTVDSQTYHVLRASFQLV